MIANEGISKRVQAHQRYQTPEGVYVPGVTTVLGLRAKPQLIAWANRLGLQGIDSSKYRDELAEVGSLAHAMILADLKGQKVDTGDYTPNQLDLAENCFLKYLEWAKGKVIKPLLVEEAIVCGEHRFGGTPDFYGEVNGERVLVDYKTGGIYPEAYVQASAYAHLLAADRAPWLEAPAKIIILSIPRTEDERFLEETHSDYERGWEIFYHLLQIYWLERNGKPLTR